MDRKCELVNYHFVNFVERKKMNLFSMPSIYYFVISIYKGALQLNRYSLYDKSYRCGRISDLLFLQVDVIVDEKEKYTETTEYC